MVSVSWAIQVINLFVRNQGERLITKPKTVQMFADEIATKLRYAPQLEDDALQLSPQAKKAAERITELKSRVIEIGGKKYTYKDLIDPRCSEDKNLSNWFERFILRFGDIERKKQVCLERVNECFHSDNVKK